MQQGVYPPFVFSRAFYYSRFLPGGSDSTCNEPGEIDQGGVSGGGGGCAGECGEVEDELALRRMFTAPLLCPLNKCKVGDVLDLFAPQVFLHVRQCVRERVFSCERRHVAVLHRHRQ